MAGKKLGGKGKPGFKPKGDVGKRDFARKGNPVGKHGGKGHI